MESTGSNSDPGVGTKDPQPSPKGVLLGDAIKKYIDEFNLIENADTVNNIKPASYNLRLGDRYYQDGKYRRLTGDNPIITIPPHGMAVVSTLEKLNMPKELIARWNLRVKLVYSGLLWAGGPQVDPGFSGHLFCPLYNLSSREVTIKREEHVFTIDFETTSPYNANAVKDNKNLEFPEAEKDRPIEKYVPSFILKSSVAELKDQVEKMEMVTTGRVNDLQSTVLIGLSIVFAGLTIVASLPSLPNLRLSLSFDSLTAFYLLLSIASLIISIFSLNRTRKLQKRDYDVDQ